MAGLLLGVHLCNYGLALAMVAFWLVVDALELPPGRDPALDGRPVLRWTALRWALAFVGPYLALALQSLLGWLGAAQDAIGVTTLGFAAVSVALWRVAITRVSEGVAEDGEATAQRGEVQ